GFSPSPSAGRVLRFEAGAEDEYSHAGTLCAGSSMSIQIGKSHRSLLLAMIAASLPACAISTASQHDYSGLPDDPFAEVVKQVRGGSRELFNNIERGQIISQQFLRGKNS